MGMYGVRRAQTRIAASKVLVARAKTAARASATQIATCRVGLDRYWLELLSDQTGRLDRWRGGPVIGIAGHTRCYGTPGVLLETARPPTLGCVALHNK